MKILLSIIFSLFIFTSIPAHAFNIDDAMMILEDATEEKVDEKTGDVKQSISLENVQNKLKENIGAKAQKEIDRAVNKVEKRLKKFEDEYKSKITDQLKSALAKIEEEAKKAFMARFGKYIIWVKIAFGFLLLSVIALIAVIYMMWKKINSFKNLAQNVTNYKDIKAQIAELEKKVAKLEG